MQLQVEFKLIALLLLLQSKWCLCTTSKDWDYFNGHSYSQSTGNREEVNNFEYVDYQARCEQGGEPVCATNGTQEFYFENECKLEAHNMKTLFQHGIVLERTELERCKPSCQAIRCPELYQPVCAIPLNADAKANGVTFGNACEVRRHECLSQRVMRILKQGVCQETKSKRRIRKNRNRNRKNKRVMANKLATSASDVHFLISTRADRMKAISTRTSTTTTTTRAPMRFKHFQYSAAPHVSVSQAENPYKIYNIPDVGKDYENILDNELSVYLPELGYVTDRPPSTATTTTTTTTTPKPMISTTTTSTTTAIPTTTPKSKLSQPTVWIAITKFKLTTTKPTTTTIGMASARMSTSSSSSSTTTPKPSITKATSWSSTTASRSTPKTRRISGTTPQPLLALTTPKSIANATVPMKATRSSIITKISSSTPNAIVPPKVAASTTRPQTNSSTITTMVIKHKKTTTATKK